MQQKGGPYPVAFFLRLFGLCAGSALTLVRAPRAARCPGPGDLVWAQVLQDYLKAFRQVRDNPGIACKRLNSQQGSCEVMSRQTLKRLSQMWGWNEIATFNPGSCISQVPPCIRAGSRQSQEWP